MEGAEPGDALEVTIVRLSHRGERVDPLPTGGERRRSRCGEPPAGARHADWAIDLAAGTVRLVDPPAGARDLALPLEPMIGCFGVAPGGRRGDLHLDPPGHGGNMDWRGFRPGAVVWFPVSVPGALLFAGDGHARQGDGEIGGTGVEVSMEMELRLDLRQRWPIRWPRGITATVAELFTVGNARPLDQALQHATTEMLAWLEATTGSTSLPPVTSWGRPSATTSAMSSTRPTPSSAGCQSR